MKTINKQNISELLNKSICFYCKQYMANSDIYGQATVKDIDMSSRNPLKVVSEGGEGDMLRYAFFNNFGELCLGDADRLIKVWPSSSHFLVCMEEGDKRSHVCNKSDVEAGGAKEVRALSYTEAMNIKDELSFYCAAKGRYGVEFTIEEVEA